MVPSPPTLVIASFLALGTLALPPNRINGAPGPGLAADRPAFPLPGSVNPLMAADHPLNFSISVPTPRKPLTEPWPVQCGHDAIPPGWAAPPPLHRIGEVYDCRRAIFLVTRDGAGDPLDPQTWTAQADWSYGSCGVFLAPGSRRAMVRFARIEVFEIAGEILRECVSEVHGWMGGWVAIGGDFVVMLTGREVG